MNFSILVKLPVTRYKCSRHKEMSQPQTETSYVVEATGIFKAEVCHDPFQSIRVHL